MAAYEVLLLNTAVPQIQAAQSGDTYVVPRDIAFSAALTLSAGTPNGVPYLSSPGKVLTTGSALTFDGTDFSNTAGKVIAGGDLRATITGTGNVGLNIARTGGTTADWYNYIPSGSADLAWFKGSEQMRLTTTGLGIGTNNPGTKLEVAGANPTIKVTADNGTQAALQLTQTGVGNWLKYFKVSDNAFVEQFGGTDLLFLTTSGNLGLGVTPSAWGSGKAIELGQVTGNALWGLGINSLYLTSNARWNGSNYVYTNDGAANLYGAGTGNGTFTWYNAPSGTANSAVVAASKSYTVVALGTTTLAQWQASFNDASNNPLTVTPTLGQVLTSLPSPVTPIPNGGLVTQNISFTQAMTLDASGNLLVGTTSSLLGTSHSFQATGTASSNYAGVFRHNGTGTNGRLLGWELPNTNDVASYFVYATNSGGNCLNIFGNGNITNSNNSYGAISDSKLKENITDATPKLDKLNQVRVVNYNLIGSEQKQIGVIAQELEQVFPSMVEETPDHDQEGNDLGTTTKSVKYSVFVPMLIKAIQELKAEFDAYKATHP